MTPPGETLTPLQRRALATIKTAPRSTADLAAALEVDTITARKAVRRLARLDRITLRRSGLFAGCWVEAR